MHDNWSNSSLSVGVLLCTEPGAEQGARSRKAHMSRHTKAAKIRTTSSKTQITVL